MNYLGPLPALILQASPLPDDDDFLALKGLAAVLGFLSLFGILFNLFTTLLVGSSSQLMDKMIIGLCIMDLINVLPVPFSRVPMTSDWICQVQSFIIDFGYGGSLSFTCCFAHFLYKTVNQGFSEVVDDIFKKYLTFSIVMAAVIGLTSVITGQREINHNTETCMAALVSGAFDVGALLVRVLPSIVSIIYCSYCYLTIVKKFRAMGKNVFVVLLLYPFILIITNLPITVTRTIIMFNSTYQVSYGFGVVIAVLYMSRGLMNAFAYGLSRRIIERYKAKCCARRKTRSVSPAKEEQFPQPVERSSELSVIELDRSEGRDSIIN